MERTGFTNEYEVSNDVYAGINPYADGTVDNEYSMNSISRKLGISTSATQTEVDIDPDTAPTSSTLNMTYNRHYEQTESKTSTKLNTKTKVVVASYIALVLALVVGIVLSSGAVTASYTSAITMEEAYMQAEDIVNKLQAELAEEDVEALTQRAMQLGYVDATNANTQMYQRLDVRPAQNFNVQTNWFDGLCDWLSSAFGG